jgi:hypothetical protein
MNVGDRNNVFVVSECAFGDKGSAESPEFQQPECVPPNTSLVYAVHVAGMAAPKDTWEMTNGERVRVWFLAARETREV